MQKHIDPIKDNLSQNIVPFIYSNKYSNNIIIYSLILLAIDMKKWTNKFSILNAKHIEPIKDIYYKKVPHLHTHTHVCVYIIHLLLDTYY